VINDVTVSEPAGASGMPCCPVTNTLTTVTIDATSQQADLDCNGLKGGSDPSYPQHPSRSLMTPVRHTIDPRVVQGL
jgi:hypothetical protein